MQDTIRVINNHLQRVAGGNYNYSDLEKYLGVIEALKTPPGKKLKVALMFICINPRYWEFLTPIVEQSKKLFLPGHNVDMFCWSDIQDYDETKMQVTLTPDQDKEFSKEQKEKYFKDEGARLSAVRKSTLAMIKRQRLTMFDTPSIEWPYPTLYRNNLFLQAEEQLSSYDRVYFLDVDMCMVNVVGDEILGEPDKNGELMILAQHPMYAFRKEYLAPFEPNPKSKAYVKHRDLYFAGGFNGGTPKSFFRLAKQIKDNIDYDGDVINYVARWNDESHLNKVAHDYMEEGKPTVILTPSFVYPDSLVRKPDGSPGYYMSLWGTDFPPKIVTLTKRFSVSKEAGDAIKNRMETL